MSLLLSIIVVASAAPATQFDLKVESANLKFVVSINEKNFRYESATKKVKQQIQPCGSRAYDLFAKKIESTIGNDFAKLKIKTPKAIQVIINKEKFYLPPLSTSGVFVSRLETDVDYLLAEAIYRCSKK